ncbi:hypothetical protein HK098_004884 [Nowakowskiella sp. JEL0407]|nr:hypothetical protein HK098_004884 [Nowakowskiella sp. JEL0407]
MACKILDALASTGESITVEAIENLSVNGAEGAMDALYFSTFDRIFGRTPQNSMKEILSSIALAFEPLKAEYLSSLLRIPLVEVEICINKLQPILHINEEGTIRFFHKSVGDYLTSSTRCFDIRFSVQIHKSHSHLTERCLTVIQNELNYNIAQLPLHTLHKDIPNFEQLVSKNVSPHLKYSALYFWQHHEASKFATTNFQRVKTFTETKFLNWIELLSLLNATNRIPSACNSLSDGYFKSSADLTDYTLELLSDAVRLYRKFNTAISGSALQTYATAIPFSPKETRIYKHFINKLPTVAIPRVAAGSGNHWPACLTTLEGHTASVTSSAISTDGKYIVSGSEDRTIRIWLTESGEEVKTLKDNQDVNWVAISRDGKYIFSGGYSGGYNSRVKKWSIENGSVIWSHENSAFALAIDGNLMVCGDSRHMMIRSTLSGDLVGSFQFPSFSSYLTWTSISADGKCIVYGDSDGNFMIRSVDSGEEVKHKNIRFVSSVAISADKKLLVCTKDHKSIKILSISENGVEVKTSINSSVSVTKSAFSADGKWIACGCSDHTIRTWSVESGEQIRVWTGHSNYISSIAISTDDKFVISSSYDRTTKIWSTESGEIFEPLRSHLDMVYSLAITVDEKRIVTGSVDSTIKVWSVEGGEEMLTLTGHSDMVSSVTISEDEKWIVSGSGDCKVKLWSIESGNDIKTFVGHSDFVWSVTITNDGKWIISGGEDSAIKIWSVERGSLRNTLRGHTGPVYSVATSANREWIVSGGEDATVKVWSFETGIEMKSLSGHSSPVYSVAFVTNNLYIASKSDGGRLDYELETGKRIDFDIPQATSLQIKNQIDVVLHGTSMDQWDGWVAVDKKTYCWLPSEYRKCAGPFLCKR